jgi:aminocarboxymuconate-semialdehyde decarboxylase
VFSGLFEKLPQMRLITHHCGAMIPFFAGRAETLWAQLGSRSAGENYDALLKTMKKKPIEYFKMFYADTVLGGSASALRCGLDFFGADRIVFASDCPFDPEGGPIFIREGIRSVEDLQLSDEDERIAYGELRLCAVGWLHGQVMLMTYTERENDFHVISLLEAQRYEVNKFFKEVSH